MPFALTVKEALRTGTNKFIPSYIHKERTIVEYNYYFKGIFRDPSTHSLDCIQRLLMLEYFAGTALNDKHGTGSRDTHL